MADAVTTLDSFSGKDLLVRRITNISDGTGEASIVKVAKAGLIGTTGVAPSKIAVEELWWSVSGFANVRLFWNHTAPDVLALLSAGNGFRVFSGVRGASGMIVDPASAGLTGDIILTTNGAIANATYDIMMVLRLLP